MTKKSDVNYVGVLRMKISDDYLESILYKQLREVNTPYRFNIVNKYKHISAKNNCHTMT